MIHFIAVDDEEIALEGLTETLRELRPDIDINAFQIAEDALAYVKKHKVHTAFLDVEMMGIDGLDLAREIQAKSPETNIIFVTGFTQYATNAFDLHASGYVTKPVTPDDIRDELAHLRNPLPDAEESERGLRVRCFGNFEAFLNGEPIYFRYQKTKELLAYLIDRRGALCSNRELEATIWGEPEEWDERHESYLRKLKTELVEVCEKAGCPDVVNRQRGNIGINIELVDCDYYRFLDGSKDEADRFCGEYMSQYSWGEYTEGFLEGNGN